MNDIVSYNHYRFVYMDFKRSFHHTDNTKGSPYHYLAYLKEGNCKIVSENETVEIKTGDVFFIPDGLPYHSYWYGQPNIKFHSYGFKYFPEAAANHFRLQTVDCPEPLRERIKQIPFRSRPNSGDLGLFYACLNEILPLLKTERSSHAEEIYINAHQCMSEHPNFPLPRVAQLCGVSESTLYTAFQKACGKTPNRVRQEILCEKATVLLTTTSRSIEYISDVLGFSSTSYFRKVLFSVLGKTPSEIRKSKLDM